MKKIRGGKGIVQKILGYNKDNLATDCLALAYDLKILSDSVKSAGIQIKYLKEFSNKVGLRLYFKKKTCSLLT